MLPPSNNDLSPIAMASAGRCRPVSESVEWGIGLLLGHRRLGTPAAAGLRVAVRVSGTGAPASRSEGETEKVLSEEDVCGFDQLGRQME